MRIDYPRFPRLLLIMFLMNILGAQLLHEAGHWLVLQLYGRRPLWSFTSLVQLADKAPKTPADWVALTNSDGSTSWLHMNALPASDLEWLLFIAAGPLIQLAAVVAGFLVARYARSAALRTMGFILALVAAFGGFFYQLVSMLRGTGGDELLIGQYLGVSPVLVSLVLAACFGIALVIGFRTLTSRKMRLTWLGALFLATIPIGPLLMIAHGTVIAQVDAGNPWFRSVIGFSLPVFLTGLVCLLLLMLIGYRWQPSPSPVAE